jgi:hypothetical protein
MSIGLHEPYSPGSPSTDFCKEADVRMESVVAIEDPHANDIVEVVMIEEETEEESENERPGGLVKESEIIEFDGDTLVEKGGEEVQKGRRVEAKTVAEIEEDEEGEIHDEQIEEEEDEDLDCLRAKLLETVASRRRKKLQEQEKRLSRESSISPPVTSMRKVVVTSHTRRNQPTNMMHLPVVSC